MSSTFATEHTTFSPDSPGGPSAPAPRLDIKRMLRQNLRLIAGVFLGLSIPLSTAVWFLTPKAYNVYAELRFQADQVRIMDDVVSRNSSQFKQWLDTQIGLITGPAVLTKVLSKPAIRALPLIAAQADPLRFMQENLQTDTKGNSELVRVSIRLQDKQAAKLIIGEIIDEYTTLAKASEADTNADKRGAINGMLDKVRAELEHQHNRVDIVLKNLNVPLSDPSQIGGEDEMTSYRDQHALASTEMSKAKQNKALLESRTATFEEAKALYAKDPNTSIYEEGIEEMVSRDPGIQYLEAELIRLQTESQTKRESLREAHPDIKDFQRRLDVIQGKLTTAKSEIRGKRISEVEARLRQDIDIAARTLAETEERTESFRKTIDDHNREQIKASPEIEQFRDATAEIDKLSTQKKDLELRQAELDLESQAPARVSIVSSPVVPTAPDSGRRLQLILLVLAGSASMGIAAALWRELTNQHARTPQDIAAVTPLPILALIPDATMERFGDNLHMPLLTKDFPDSPTADEVRRILARIIYPPDDTVEVNSCMITSPTRGDGKTTLACNLAIALAQANRRVLLIDVCPRNPRVEWSFGLEPDAGLAEALLGEASFDMLARPTELENLNVLGPGRRVEELRGKLASRAMTEFLEMVEKDYDHVIIDTPPALLMSDAKLLAPIVDGVVVVIGSGASTLGMFRRCLTELDQVSANLIGIVINRMKPTRGGYMRRNLELFYHYEDRSGEARVARDLPEMKISDMELDDENEDDSLEPAIVLLAGDERNPRRDPFKNG